MSLTIPPPDPYAIPLLGVYADRTNRLRMQFAEDIDSYSLELGSSTLVHEDGGQVPSHVVFEAVPGSPSEVFAYYDGDLRAGQHAISYSGLLGLTGDYASGTVAFYSLPRSAPRISPYDQRLKIDLGLSTTVGGDVALLVGDSFLRQQAERLLTWSKGELLADPAFGVPWRFQGPASTRALTEYRDVAERKLKGLPGVLSAGVRLEQTSDMLRVSARIKTDQTELELSVQRLLGR